MDQKILTLLKNLQEELQEIKLVMVTKNDAKQFATKDDLKQFATKDDLKRFATKNDLKRFATKNDLKRFATKNDLKRFATKDDLKPLVTKTYFDTKLKRELQSELKKLREDIVEDICKINTDLFQRTDEIKANKTEVAILDKRVTKLEHN